MMTAYHENPGGSIKYVKRMLKIVKIVNNCEAVRISLKNVSKRNL